MYWTLEMHYLDFDLRLLDDMRYIDLKILEIEYDILTSWFSHGDKLDGFFCYVWGTSSHLISFERL